MLNEWLLLPHSCSFFIIWWLSITRGRVTLQFLWILYSNSFHTSRGEVFFSKAAETSLTSDFESCLCAACSLCFSLTMWNDRIYQNMDIFVPGCSGGKKKRTPNKKPHLQKINSLLQRLCSVSKTNATSHTMLSAEEYLCVVLLEAFFHSGQNEHYWGSQASLSTQCRSHMMTATVSCNSC